MKQSQGFGNEHHGPFNVTPDSPHTRISHSVPWKFDERSVIPGLMAVHSQWQDTATHQEFLAIGIAFDIIPRNQ